jgi:hypothetical protein
LWAAATLGLSDASVIRPLADAADLVVSSLSCINAKAFLQAYFAGLELHDSTSTRCWRILSDSPTPPTVTSQLQQDVASTLRSMGYGVQLEVPVLQGLLTTDIVATSAAGVRAAVEVDGPTHYLRAPLSASAVVDADASTAANAAPMGPPTGATRLRNRLLATAAAGFSGRVAVVSFYAWDACRSQEERRRLLSGLL